MTDNHVHTLTCYQETHFVECYQFAIDELQKENQRLEDLLTLIERQFREAKGLLDRIGNITKRKIRYNAGGVEGG